MKKYILIMCAGLLMTACMDNFQAESVDTSILTAENVGEPNTTITDVRTKFASEISNSNYKLVEEDMVIEGIVTANDISGNLYQKILIQEISVYGTNRTNTPGIMVSIKGVGNLYTIFPVGQRIRVNLKGLYVGGYGKLATIGQPYLNTNSAMKMGPMTAQYMKTNIQKVGKANAAAVMVNTLEASDITAANIDKLTPMLVVIRNVTIPDAKKEDKEDHCYAYSTSTSTYSVEHKVTFSDGTVPSDFTLYTSTSAHFAAEPMPTGQVTIFGVLGRYNNSYQLQARSEDDILMK